MPTDTVETALAMSEKLGAPQELAAPRNMLEAVMRAATDPTVDPARLRELLEIGERLEARTAKEHFNRAVAEVQPLLPVIDKNGLIEYKAGSGKGAKFAKWDDIYKACVPALSQHGFSCSFSNELQGGNALCVTMRIRHAGGGEDSASAVVPWLDTGGSKSPAQAAASSFSIGQRHVFIKYWNIRTQDPTDTGEPVRERITDEQAAKLQDLVQAAIYKDSAFERRFTARLKAEMHTESLGELFQGEQYETVIGWFKK